MNSPYRSAFREALEELELALKAKDGLERRVAELQSALPALARLGKPTRHEEKLMAELMEVAQHGRVNLTRAVRLVLAMAERPLTTVQIRDQLLRRNFSFSAYSNPMAAIHSALNRMAASGEVRVEQSEGARPRFISGKKSVQSEVVPHGSQVSRIGSSK
jgi:hypothetical protein